MTINTLDKLELYKERVDLELDSLISDIDSPYTDLFKACRYSVNAPAKRLRPLLTLLCTEMLGASIETALLPACALELVHTYSLIHDDLPCMDNDDLRRGRPTLHKVFPESYALLAGDSLLTYAFEVIIKAPDLDAEQKNHLILCLAQRAGGHGMIAGQLVDLASENKHISIDTLKLMHHKKTAQLFIAAVQFAGIIAKVSEETLVNLVSFARYIGQAFQIIDDILDITSPEELLGKTANSDIENHKATYPSILGLEQSKHEAIEATKMAREALAKIPGQHDIVIEFTDKILTRVS